LSVSEDHASRERAALAEQLARRALELAGPRQPAPPRPPGLPPLPAGLAKPDPSVEAAETLGLALLALARPAEAREVLAQLTSDPAPSALALDALACAEADLGDADSARTTRERAKAARASAKASRSQAVFSFTNSDPLGEGLEAHWRAESARRLGIDPGEEK
jgi:hypothetical protein